jgi:hypothetical protein
VLQEVVRLQRTVAVPLPEGDSLIIVEAAMQELEIASATHEWKLEMIAAGIFHDIPTKCNGYQHQAVANEMCSLTVSTQAKSASMQCECRKFMLHIVACLLMLPIMGCQCTCWIAKELS